MSSVAGETIKTMRVASQQRSRETQKRFIKATLKLAAASPMHLVTSKNISLEAETAWGSAQHLFGGKEALFSAAIEYASAQMIDLTKKEFTRPDYRKSDLDNVVHFLWNASNKSKAILCHKLASSCLHDQEFTQRNRKIINASLEEVKTLINTKVGKYYPQTDQNSLQDLLSIIETFLTGLHFRTNFTRPHIMKVKLDRMSQIWAAQLQHAE
ncbi:MAG: hypothetical protein AAGC95_08395 [Pseudomonadota bacterium]